MSVGGAAAGAATKHTGSKRSTSMTLTPAPLAQATRPPSQAMAAMTPSPSCTSFSAMLPNIQPFFSRLSRPLRPPVIIGRSRERLKSGASRTARTARWCVCSDRSSEPSAEMHTLPSSAAEPM